MDVFTIIAAAVVSTQPICKLKSLSIHALLIFLFCSLTLPRLKKTAEHRETVLQRKKALEEKKAAIPFSEIEGDKSDGKLTSHIRLQQFLEKFGEAAFEKAYTKKQIQLLCMGYGLRPNNRETKKKMVQDLLPVIKAIDKMTQAYFTNVLQSQVNLDEGTQRITLRISRAD